MPRRKRTPEEIATMRETILDAAAHLLHEVGPKALSIRAIARRVGVSHMVLYTYFSSHEALMEALRERQRARMELRREDALRRAEAGEAAEVVREFLSHFRHMAARNPRMYRFVWVDPLDIGDPAMPRPNPMRHDAEHLDALIRLGVAQGAFVPCKVEDIAPLCLAVVNAPLMMLHTGRIADAALAERLAVQTVEVAMEALERGNVET